MLRELYDFERVLELGRLEREEQMRREQALLVAQGRADRTFAGLAFVAYVLTLFRPA